MEEFSAQEDPRCGGKVEHRLIDVLTIAVCAVIAGAEVEFIGTKRMRGADIALWQLGSLTWS